MARNFSLLSVTSLELGPSSHYLVGMCPNLERLESGGGWYESGGYSDETDWRVLFIQSAASATKLKRFAMDGSFAGWSPALATGMFIFYTEQNYEVVLTNHCRSRESHAPDRKPRNSWLCWK